MPVERGSNMALITSTAQGDFIVLENDSLGRALIKDKEYDPTHHKSTIGLKGLQSIGPVPIMIEALSNN